MRALSAEDPVRLGPYRLVAVVGTGGMGRVYLARDPRGRATAVKVMRPELWHDTHMVERFRREGTAARAVRSRGVARVLQVADDGPTQWIATEFLAGPTLHQAVRAHGPLPPPAVRALGAVLARTLREVHAAGLVHRDIKPSNIVLTSGGPRIIDFGIARPEHGLTLTHTGQAPATPGFAPPEQLLGRRTGPAADVFALGAVLAFAASGRVPFEGGHVAAVQYQVVHGEPELGAVPAELREVVASCLAKEPDRRPAPRELERVLAPRGAAGLRPGSSQAVRMLLSGPLAADIAAREAAVRDLLDTVADEDTAGGGAGARAGRPDGPGRRRVVGLLAAGGVVAAGGGAAAWWLLRGGGGPGRDAATWEATPLRTYSPGATPDPLWDVTGAADAQGPDPLPLRELVVVVAPNGRPTAHRVTDGARRWRGETAVTGAPLAAGDTVLAVSREGARLLALDAASGRQRWAAAVNAAVLLAVDASRAYLVTQQNRLTAVELASRRTLWTVSPPVGCTARKPAAAAADGDRLVLFGTDGRVAALSATTGRVAWRRAGQGGSALAPAIAGDTVYLGGDHLTAVRLDDGGERWSRLSDGESGWGAPTVVEDALYAVDGTSLKRCERGGGDTTWTARLHYDPLPPQAPTVQAGTVWVALDEKGVYGVVATRTDDGTTAWPYTRTDGGPWRLAAAGNRVFVTQAGDLVAMPVAV